MKKIAFRLVAFILPIFLAVGMNAQTGGGKTTGGGTGLGTTPPVRTTKAYLSTAGDKSMIAVVDIKKGAGLGYKVWYKKKATDKNFIAVDPAPVLEAAVSAEPTDADLIVTVPAGAHQMKIELLTEAGVEATVKFRRQ